MAMVAKGNKDGHRYSMSGFSVQEESKWGRSTARKRYGEPRDGAPAPADNSEPQQDPNVKRGSWAAGSHSLGDVPVTDWKRAPGESAESKPYYDKQNPWRKGR